MNKHAVREQGAVQLYLNPRCVQDSQEYDASLQSILSVAAFEQAQASIVQWPGYAPTPLRHLPGLAAQMKVGGVYYKDEAGRFGLGSFKALGGAYAVNRLLLRQLQAHTGNASLTLDDLKSPAYKDFIAGLTVTCATDGNHGRSVAWGAKNAGCQCVIYIHEHVSTGREQAIASYGAMVVRVPGNYDDSVRQAAEDAKEHGYFVVSDTSYPGYMDVPKDVMQGYTVMVQEALDQIASGKPVTHVFIQGGVGGLAAAVCAHMWERLGAQRPRLIVVEPNKADCLFQSAVQGKPVTVTGDLNTVMAGLACGEISLLAWEILDPGTYAYMTLEDDAALQTMRRLARADKGDAPIVAGESAVAGVAACMAACEQADWRQALGIDENSQILFFASEGDTDAELYQRIVGMSAKEVLAQEPV